LEKFNILEESGIQPYWFIIFEIIYIVIFVAISVAIHLFGFLKTDEDAVTIHHKIHKEVIAQQERKFMSQNKVRLSFAFQFGVQILMKFDLVQRVLR
ncbi:hypothetical protein ANCCAN_12231, partial [Ancylostoma caninum]